MTAYPIPANHNHWWLVTPGWRRLHAVPVGGYGVEAVVETEYMRAPDTAVCGLAAEYTYPGLLSRYGLARCAHCCRALGIPRGRGTPVNEQSELARRNGG